MNCIIEKIVSDISLDTRIDDGIFTIENNDHMDIMREYLTEKGIDESEVREFCNKVLEGKHPERQAYNKNGILVTFPTPEYKQRAMQRGTHFEKDPTKAAPNIFGAQPKSPDTIAKKDDATDKSSPTTETPPKTNLPLSKAAEPMPDTSTDQPAPVTTAAPESDIEEEPPIEPTELPPPEPKSPDEKEANKKVIIKMLQSNDYTMEEDFVNEVLRLLQERRDV